MAHHSLFRKHGIPASACPVGESESKSEPNECLCSLVIKVNQIDRQAAIVLRFNLPVQGFDTDQSISLIYNADNWEPGQMMRGQVAITPWHLDHLARGQRGGNNMYSLSVVLRHSCTVLCPPALATYIAPKDGSTYPFQRLVALAKATRISIVFDGAWLHRDKSALFAALFARPPKLVKPFPHDNSQEIETDWRVFGPSESAPPEAPPAYQDAYRDASLKRSDRSPICSPRASPPKRQLLDLGSPTEKATTIAATPSPLLPPSSPVAGFPDIQDAITKAVAEKLPDVLKAVLPDTLARVFAVPVPASASSLPATAAPAPSPPNPMSAIHQYILDHLTTHAGELAKQVTSDTLKHANDLRDAADLQFQDELEDQRLELTVLKEDGLLEIQAQYDQKLEEFKEKMTELREEQENDMEEACTTARDNLDTFFRRRRLKLKRELLRVELDMSRPRVGAPNGSGSRRATSVPPEVGW